MAPPLSDSSQANGFWGNPTSTLDWCEKNYEVTNYIAEFWNTLTNVSMILPGIYGLIQCHKLGLDHRHKVCFFLLLAVGVGSWMFHMTLQYYMQLMDELPMIWAGSFYLLCIFKVKEPSMFKNPVTAVILFSFALCVTIVYLVCSKPIFHEVMYGCLVFATIWQSFKITRTRGSYHKGFALFVVCIVLQVTGFILWNVDVAFCGDLTRIREELASGSGGKVLGYSAPLTQLHGWWHILTGYGAYLFLLFSVVQRSVHSDTNVHLKPSIFIGVEMEKGPQELNISSCNGHHKPAQKLD